jgi:hypothetical protein
MLAKHLPANAKGHKQTRHTEEPPKSFRKEALLEAKKEEAD